MADGPQNNRIGFIIQARMKSTRLPGKILYPLPFYPDGKPVLHWIIYALKRSKQIGIIILATTVESEDDVLTAFANQQNVILHRGSENDVLRRFAEAVQISLLDTIVRITGDNPILPISEIDELVIRHIENKNDYTCSENLPLGMNIEIIKGSVITAINSIEDLTLHDREHVTPYIKRSKSLQKEFVPLCEEKLTEKMRLTIDYPADYAALNLVMQHSLQSGLTGLALVNYINKTAPWVWQINNEKHQVQQYSNQNEEVTAAIKQLNSLGFFHAASILENAKQK